MEEVIRRIRMPALRSALTWALMIWIVVFWRLGYASLLDPDEAHYAQLTREMMRAHQWFVPILDGVPFIDKPAFYHWLQAAAEWLLGENEFALRLPSAGAAMALIWTVWWIGRSLTDRTVGSTAAKLFATTPLTFALASIGVFDMVYTAFLFGAIACLLVAAVTNRPRLEYVGWPLLVFAVMTKGPVAVLLTVLFGIALAIPRTTRPLVNVLRWRLGLSFVALVASPWFVYMAVTFGNRFVHDYLLAGNLWYFTRPAEFSAHHSDVFFYARTYLGACFPWSLLALGVGLDALVNRRRLSAAEQALWIWIGLILVFFTVAGFKLDTYIFPAAPATCLVTAMGWQQAALDRRTSVLRGTVIAGWAIAVVLIVAGGTLAATIFRIDLGLSALAGLLPCALVGGGLLLVWHLRQSHVSAIPGVLVGTLLVVYSVVVVEGFPVLERSRPTAPVGRWVARHAPDQVPIGVYGLDDWRGSIRFYSRHQLVVLHDAG